MVEVAIMYVYVNIYIHMTNHQALTSSNQENPLLPLWPALKGSLAQVYKPCIRKGCPACARGDKHPAWLLSFRAEGKRKTMYVPLALVPTLKKALANGRKIEALLYRMGPHIIKNHRQKAQTS
jgi:hypothetical protein